MVILLGAIGIVAAYHLLDAGVIELPPLVELTALVSMHVVLGMAAWRSHYLEWGNQVGYLLGYALIIWGWVTHWSAWALPVGVPDYMQQLVVVAGFALPAIMLAGGALIPALFPRAADEVEE